MEYRCFTIFGERLRCYKHPDHDPKSLVGERVLAPGEIDALCKLTETLYRKKGSFETQEESDLRLVVFGKKLYEWLDGPTERLLEVVKNAPLSIHIDVEERLRHLPWELLHDGKLFICDSPLHPVTPIRRVNHTSYPLSETNRALRLFFMASSPLDVQPVLAYEEEEATILRATTGQPIELLVEESGSLNGLKERIANRPAGYFDVIHLTGHADVRNGEPGFLLEDDFGKKDFADATRIATAFQGRMPRVLFLSGCKTANAPEEGKLPSLCEALVNAGIPAVLGWSLPVSDVSATQAAGTLYQFLATGMRVDEAVARTRQKLKEDKWPDWHLLRLYTNATLPNALVTPLETEGRAQISLRAPQMEFIEEGAKEEVCSREAFIGRRREIQRCLKALRSLPNAPSYHAGVLLHYMGGLGKSSLAIRLCERLQHERIVWVGRVDETALIIKLSQRFTDPRVGELLNQPGLSLEQRLRNVLKGPLASKPILFLFDDFEQNLDPNSTNGYAVKPDALVVISAVLNALHREGSRSRALITCRYEFALPGPGKLYHEGLTELRGADLNKILKQLPSFIEAEESLSNRAMALAGGNPRLLHWLASVLENTSLNHDEILSKLEAETDKFRLEEVLIQELLAAQTPELVRLLARLSVCNLPIDAATVLAISAPADSKESLQHAVAVSLCERGIDPLTQESLYYVSHLVRPLINESISEDERKESAGAAARHLYEHRLKFRDMRNESQMLEIVKLALQSDEIIIARVVGRAVTNNLVNHNRNREAVVYCNRLLTEGDNYGIRLDLARAQTILGMTLEAQKNYELALASCPVEEKKIRSSILFNMSGLVKNQGDTKRASALLQKSSEFNEADDSTHRSANLHEQAANLAQQGDVKQAKLLYLESIKVDEQCGNFESAIVSLHSIAGLAVQHGNNVKASGIYEICLNKSGDERSKAATYHAMAYLEAQQSNFERAMALNEEALKLYSKIGDTQSMAKTLSNMGELADRIGDFDEARGRTLEAVRILASIRAFLDLIVPLQNLSEIDRSSTITYQAQAFWLSLFLCAPADEAILTSHNFVPALGPGEDSALYVSACALMLTMQRERKHPEYQRLLATAIMPLGICAEARGILPDKFIGWLNIQRLLDPNVIVPKVVAALREMIGNSWLFDPAELPQTEPWSHFATEV